MNVAMMRRRRNSILSQNVSEAILQGKAPIMHQRVAYYPEPSAPPAPEGMVIVPQHSAVPVPVPPPLPPLQIPKRFTRRKHKRLTRTQRERAKLLDMMHGSFVFVPAEEANDATFDNTPAEPECTGDPESELGHKQQPTTTPPLLLPETEALSYALTRAQVRHEPRKTVLQSSMSMLKQCLKTVKFVVLHEWKSLEEESDEELVTHL